MCSSISRLLVALRHHLHAGPAGPPGRPRQAPRQRGGAGLPQQPHQPHPLHRHQQGREERLQEPRPLQENQRSREVTRTGGFDGDKLLQTQHITAPSDPPRPSHGQDHQDRLLPRHGAGQQEARDSGAPELRSSC